MEKINAISMPSSTPSASPQIINNGNRSLINLAIGAAIQVFEVSTLGQPFEVLKTHMAAHRSDSLVAAMQKTYSRGGIFGFYQGLIPWAWIEASTKGAILLFASSEIDHRLKSNFGMDSAISGILAGMGGGIAQAYTTMGFCTFMKTVEVTRHKSISNPSANTSTLQIAYQVWKKEGIKGLNKGVSAVALRQMTNWGSRIGISRITENIMMTMGPSNKDEKGETSKGDGKRKLSTGEKLLASVIGGALGCWNQPIEVIRVEMQSQAKAVGRPEKLNIWSTASYIWKNHGFMGFYRGVTPRIGLGVYLTVCMVFGGDQIKQKFNAK